MRPRTALLVCTRTVCCSRSGSHTIPMPAPHAAHLVRPTMQAVWLYVLPADALEMLRTSAVKVAKAAQAVAKLCLQV